MPDTNGGGDLPKRPGTNVDNNLEPASHGKRSRNKRKRSTSGGIQANSAEINKDQPASVSSREPAFERTSENKTASSAPHNFCAAIIGEPNSKRARRRHEQKQNSAASKELDTSLQAQSEIVEPVGENSQTPSSTDTSSGQKRNRRRVRRPNRRSSADHNKKSLEQTSNDQNQERKKQARQPNAASQTRMDKNSSRPKDVYAALDLGTNNCRLLVAIPQQPGRFRVIDAFSRIVRLGEGLAASGRLNDQAMDRAVEALKACADKLAIRETKNVRLIATEACRRAENGEEFLSRVHEEAGLKLEIVDRETEARLAVSGCSSLVDRKAKGVVLFDIGGGSSELALLDLRKRKRHDLSNALVSWTSLPLGVVTLSEKHGGGKLVTRPVFDNMVDEVANLLEKFEGRDELANAYSQGEVHLLGTSGTVTTLAGIHLKLPRYDRRKVDGIWMVSQDVDAMIQTLVDMSYEQRCENPCIGNERADLVLAGCAILVAIQNLWPCERLRVADRGLREGLLTDMMNADNAWLRRRHRPKRWRK